MNDRRAQRGLRDEAGVGPDPRESVKLTPLKDLKHHKVASGEPDIRSWPVFSASGRELGEVDDLLVDTATSEVVMVDIDLKRDNHHTLAPIKAAWIDRAHKRVVINSEYLVTDDAIPALEGRATPAAESVRRFNERYERAYGDLGWDRGRDYTIRRGSDEWRIARSLPPPSEISGQPDALGEATSDREVRFPRIRADRSPGEPIVIEEVVMRRRIVDSSELDPAELERLRTTDLRDGIQNPPPGDERR
jgi:hypothetical protein